MTSELSNISNMNTPAFPKILVVNDRPLRTGAGRYASQIHTAIEGNARFISYVWNPVELQMQFPGEVHSSRLTKKNSRHGGFKKDLIRFLPSLFQRDYISLITKFKEKGYHVHYTSHLTQSVDPDGSDIVSVLDLIAINEFFKQPKTFLLLKKYLQFSHIITISNYVSKLIKLYNRDSCPQTIYPYVSESFFKIEKKLAREKLGIPSNKKIILSISSTQQRKNLSKLKETMNVLGDEYLLLRVGPPVSNSLTFHNIDDSALNLIYNSSDALLFPTKEEGFGYPLIEAMKVGLPIVSSDIEVVREVTDGNAYLGDPNDTAALSKMIREAVSSSDDVVRKAMDRANLFNLKRFRTELMEYYSKTEKLEG
jgi:glycosyltransferase involved in cell wall biosynthesis